MDTKEYQTIDKAEWGAGPWMREPDKKQWQDEATGYPCLVVRGPSGALCGYVGVSEGHPAFKQSYENVNVDVHGGLTYADLCSPGDDESEGICHVPGPGEPDHVWWLGFDCAHYGDFMPKYDSQHSSAASYRDIAYVESEIARLAKQLKALES